MSALSQLTGLGPDALLMVVAGAALLAGAVIGWLATMPAISRWRRRHDRLQAQFEAERRVNEERREAFEQARKDLSDAFSALSSRALRENNEAFLQLAGQQFKREQSESKSELEKRQHAIEQMVKPIREALDKTGEQIRQIEKERKEAYGNISKYLETMHDSQRELRSETQNLVRALRRPEVRGRWGEIQLRRLVELAGMLEHCDFETQVDVKTEEGRVRPDLVVNLPEERHIIVDAKTPLDSYLDATEARDEDERRGHLLQHYRKVRERMEELSKKAYWSQFTRSPEFVVLFLPGEQYLAAALDQDPGLLERALSQRVIIATPTSLMGLLKAVAYSWRQVDLIENAEQIRDIGVELYDRLATFTEHLGKLGNALNSSVDNFNRAIGSLDRRVLPSARRFKELGITSAKEVESLEPVDKQARD